MSLANSFERTVLIPVTSVENKMLQEPVEAEPKIKSEAQGLVVKCRDEKLVVLPNEHSATRSSTIYY